jgi:hypothetical protein
MDTARGEDMDFSAQLDDLAKRAAAAKASVQAAATESRDQLRQSIDQAQVDANLAMKDDQQQAGEATDRARSKWAEMKADAAAKMGDVKAKIDGRRDKIDAKMADQDAANAEADAVVAIEGADWAVENARLQTLDAIDARAHAEERAKAAGLS